MSVIPVTELKGIGPKTAEALARLGIRTTEDLVRHFPSRFAFYPKPEEIGEISEEGLCAVAAAPQGPLNVIRRGRFVMTRGRFSDGTGSIDLVWYNMPWLKKSIHSDVTRVYCGKAQRKAGKLVLEQPAIFTEAEYEALTGRPVPVYPLTQGVSNKTLTGAIGQALLRLPVQEDWMTEEERVRYGLCEEDTAVRRIHAPRDMQEYETARKRIVFDEFYSFLLDVRELKRKIMTTPSGYVMQTEPGMTEYRDLLPFTLTEAQEHAASEICRDLEGGTVMNRLLQGDVGSGKTAVAAAALYIAFRNGCQSAIMVPTEVLAQQHYRTMQQLFSGAEHAPRLLLLTGSLKASEKRAAREAIRDHEADIVIGTHALIQEDVVFDSLSLVVTDEQHRFGVGQRELLASKGLAPHMLVMSATPIPRTLAVILYGDLENSVLDARPAGRLPVKNAVIPRKDRPKALLHIRKEIEKGHQAYSICPLVEESELSDEENVTDYSEKLAESFRGIATVGSLHGRMKEKEKQEIMDRFLRKEIDILVSTTVVEVGVDVPNATVMMVENAERFGLATLHQLRGRVGRGAYQSYCIFVQGKRSETASERLEILKRSNDGFEIAAADLRMRGPGELFGELQSGELTFRLGDIYNDYGILKDAKALLDARTSQPDPGEGPAGRRGVIL